MKKLLLSIFVLASLTSQARPADYTQADALDAKEAAAGYCSQYNETALRSIYKKLLSSDVGSLQAQVTQNNMTKLRCAHLLRRAELLGQEDLLDGERALQVYEECKKDEMSQQQVANSTTIVNAAMEARRFKNDDLYVAYHTRRGSSEACEASYQQTQALKALLNL